MPRTFISFLGAVTYQQAKYYQRPDRSDLSEPMYYVQEAILAAQDKPWGADDKIWIFTTDEAFKNNFEGRITNNPKRGDIKPNEGLKAALQCLQQKGQITHFGHIAIPNGYSNSEMWGVFEEVFSKIRDEDELYLDVTFGFRSLPMLATILVNYARTLKRVHVNAIYYGIFEAGRQERTNHDEKSSDSGQSEDSSHVEAPIVDLNVFTELQDWTYAAQSFLVSGNTDLLTELTKHTHPAFSKDMKSFSKAILNCRGYNLVQTEPIDELKATIGTLGQDSGIQQQLKPLLEKVGEKIQPFRSKTTENGFAAVQWCIDHGMVQQGITFLEETLKSYIIENTIGAEFLNSFIYREAAKTALRGKRREIKNFTKKNRIEDEVIIAKINNALEKMYGKVTKMGGIKEYYGEFIGPDGFRNDINHCGFRENPLSPDELKHKLEDLFSKIKPLLYAD